MKFEPNGVFNPGGSTQIHNRTMSTGAELPGILRDRDQVQVESVEKETVISRRMNTDIPLILPHERVFPIQIGNQLFRLSGASISSDGMSYVLIDEGGGVRMRD